mmetsp:Transcript_114085/g.245385  ORF Transcript_114085/g.245385 Transcript_114085/m.245385 type:complete len:209 (-) Transcript_114085:78-704(-)
MPAACRCRFPVSDPRRRTSIGMAPARAMAKRFFSEATTKRLSLRIASSCAPLLRRPTTSLRRSFPTLVHQAAQDQACCSSREPSAPMGLPLRDRRWRHAQAATALASQRAPWSPIWFPWRWTSLRPRQRGSSWASIRAPLSVRPTLLRHTASRQFDDSPRFPSASVRATMPASPMATLPLMSRRRSLSQSMTVMAKCPAWALPQPRPR